MNIGSVVQVGGAVRHNPLPPLTSFGQAALDDNQDRASSFKSIQESTLGGFIGDGQLAWRAVGPTIEILDPFTCTRQAAWTFGAILHNTAARITCVCGIGIGTVTHVVIGIDLGTERSPQGMVGILSLRRSRITRSFQFTHKVTNVCMVSGGDKVVDPSTLASELRSCQGLLAVATSHASIFLVDLGLDLGADEITSDEVSPASLLEISVPDPHAELKRNEAISKHNHLILCLSETISSGGLFRLLGADDNILFEAPSHAVDITALLYVPQLASLLVGYSFGSFQIINLNIITIDCASPYEEHSPPVFAFAYQEPENDPSCFVYLWVCRSCPEKGSTSSSISTQNNRNNASFSLYSMHYEKKEWIEGHGLWYQLLLSMSNRFDFEATGIVGERMLTSATSKIFAAMTVIGATTSSAMSPFHAVVADALASSDEQSEPVPELSLCIFCWEGSFLDQGRFITQHYISIFDINQWYQSQMPSRLRLEENQLCPYMSFHIMDKVPKSLDEKLLSGAPRKGSWSRHVSPSHCENDWFPSSLSYEFHLLTSEGIVTYRCPSIQQNAISSLMQQGPGAIVNPHSAFSTCLFAGIVSPDALNTGSSTVSEREHLLNTALEYHLLSLLLQCVVEFSEGRFSHVGCSLQLLLEWAWNKVRLLKESYSNLCAPLFIPSSGAGVLSNQSLINLHQNLTYLSHLITVVSAIRDNAGEVTCVSAGELEGRVQVVQLLKLHLQAILWFYHCGLLPQIDPEDSADDNLVPFPAEVLQKIYNNRHSEIQSLSSTLNGSEILLIDSIIEESGTLLGEIWEKVDRGDGKSIYPPPSLHSLLSMYLLPSMATSTKHRIIQYLFLDLASLLSDNYSQIVEELVKFPSSFSLSPSVIKLTQAFWLIDHKDFQAGLSVLLDPLVNPDDISPTQHRRIVKAFLFQGEEAHALTYTQIRQPPKIELEDIRINLTILLANGKIREAFHYQRTHRVTSNAKDLLHHMFTGCEQLGRLESVVHMPLSPMEEEEFIRYLHCSKHPAAQDILLCYYLQQSRYGEIASLHDGFRNSSSVDQIKQKTRSAIVQGYLSHLPDIRAQSIASQKPKPIRTVYTKPQPLSARIRQNTPSMVQNSRSTSFRDTTIVHGNSGEGMKQVVPYTPFRSKAQRRRAIGDWKEEVGLVLNKSQHIEKELQKDSTRIIFPTHLDDSFSRKIGKGVIPALINASTRLETPSSSRQAGLETEISTLQEEIAKVMEDILRKSLNVTNRLNNSTENTFVISRTPISADVVSLLKTPPVMSRRPLSRQQTADSSTETPQSILKVRKILQRPQSPLSESELASPFPTFPLHRSAIKGDKLKSSENVDMLCGVSLTPKHLRFDLPSSRLSPDQVVHKNDEKSIPLYKNYDNSADRKRKRSGSSLESSPSMATPRKSLPRYSEKHLRLDYGFTSSDSEDDAVPSTNPVITNCSESPLVDSPTKTSSVAGLNKYRSLSEIKDSSRNKSVSSTKFTSNVDCDTFVNSRSSLSKDLAIFCETTEKRPSEDVTLHSVSNIYPENISNEVFSPAESMLDDSFHSVVDYQSDEENILEKGKNLSVSDILLNSSDKSDEFSDKIFNVTSRRKMSLKESPEPSFVTRAIDEFSTKLEEFMSEKSSSITKTSPNISRKVLEFSKVVEEQSSKVSHSISMHNSKLKSVSSKELVKLETSHKLILPSKSDSIGSILESQDFLGNEMNESITAAVKLLSNIEPYIPSSCSEFSNLNAPHRSNDTSKVHFLESKNLNLDKLNDTLGRKEASSSDTHSQNSVKEYEKSVVTISDSEEDYEPALQRLKETPRDFPSKKEDTKVIQSTQKYRHDQSENCKTQHSLEENDNHVIEFSDSEEREPVLQLSKDRYSDCETVPQQNEDTCSDSEPVPQQSKVTNSDSEPVPQNVVVLYKEFVPLPQICGGTNSEVETQFQVVKDAYSESEPKARKRKETYSECEPFPQNSKSTYNDYLPVPKEIADMRSKCKPVPQESNDLFNECEIVPQEIKEVYSNLFETTKKEDIFVLQSTENDQQELPSDLKSKASFEDYDKYVLKFSDSEEESEPEPPKVSDFYNLFDSLPLKSMDANIDSLKPSKYESTIVIEEAPYGEHKKLEHEKNDKVTKETSKEISTHLVTNFEFTTIPPVELIDKESKVIDIALKDDTSVPSRTINKSGETQNIDSIPVLQFSDDESISGCNVSVAQSLPVGTFNGQQTLSEEFDSDDSDKTIEFDVSQLNTFKKVEFTQEITRIDEENSCGEKIESVEKNLLNESKTDETRPIIVEDVLISEKNEIIGQTEATLVVDDGHHENKAENSEDSSNKANLTEIFSKNESLQADSLYSYNLNNETKLGPLHLETSPDNNNIHKDAFAEAPSKVNEILTPSRSRRLSITRDVETVIDNNVQELANTPTTPLRRSSRLVAKTPTKTLELLTPTRRKRRLSETSEKGDLQTPAKHILESVKGTPSRSRKQEINQVPVDIVHKTPVDKITKDSINEICLTPVPDSKKTRSRSSLGDTPTHIPDTPTRRSARLSSVADSLGTIVEEENRSSPKTPISVGSNKTPNKRTPRIRRKSLIQNMTVVEPLLETIREDGEDSIKDRSHDKFYNFADANDTSIVVISRARSVTPETTSAVKRTRRRFSSASEASIDLQNNAPVSRRTRTSLSSNFSEGSPEGSVVKSLTATTKSDKGSESGDSKFSTFHENYLVISPLEENVISGFQDQPPVSSLSFISDKRRGRLSWRKPPGHRLSTISTDSGPCFEETPQNKRKSGRRKTVLSSSTLIIKSNRTELDTNIGNTEDDGTTNGHLRVEESEVPLNEITENQDFKTEESPDVLYRLLEVPSISPALNKLIVNYNQKGRKFKSAYDRKRISSLPHPTVDTEPYTEETNQNKRKPGRRKTTLSSSVVIIKANNEGEETNLYNYKEGCKANGPVSIEKSEIPFTDFIERQKLKNELSDDETLKPTPNKRVRKSSKSSVSNKEAAGNENSILLVNKGATESSFLFKNPEEEVLTPEVISNVFKSLKEAVAEELPTSFVFSPPLNENKKKRVRTSRKYAKK